MTGPWERPVALRLSMLVASVALWPDLTGLLQWVDLPTGEELDRGWLWSLSRCELPTCSQRTEARSRALCHS